MENPLTVTENESRVGRLKIKKSKINKLNTALSLVIFGLFMGLVICSCVFNKLNAPVLEDDIQLGVSVTPKQEKEIDPALKENKVLREKNEELKTRMESLEKIVKGEGMISRLNENLTVLKDENKYAAFQNMLNSHLVNSPEDQYLLLNYLPAAPKSIKHVYSTSSGKDGDCSREKFNKLFASVQGPKLSILKTKQGEILGGYTEDDWKRPANKMEKKSFIINFNEKSREMASDEYPIFRHRVYGEIFGLDINKKGNHDVLEYEIHQILY